MSARPRGAGALARLGTPAVRTRLGTLGGVVILAVLLWRLDTGVLLEGLRRIDGPALLAGLGIGLVTTVFSAWRWALVARGIGIRLPLGAAVADYYRALFLNAALPGGVWGRRPSGRAARAERRGPGAGGAGGGAGADRRAARAVRRGGGGADEHAVAGARGSAAGRAGGRARCGGSLCGGAGGADESGAGAAEGGRARGAGRGA
ncbi:hypothetical protein GCM10023238_03310 [Streptomyces heliomycini]